MVGAAALVGGAHHADAAELFLQSNVQVAHIGQEFYVDVMLDPAGEPINAVSATVTIPRGMSWVSASDDGSIMGTWIERPRLVDGAVEFSGMIPNGFSGFIDPENPTTRKPGRLVRLVMRGESAGSGTIAVSQADAYINDGEGTRARVTSAPFAVRIDRVAAPMTLASNDQIPPEILDVQIIRDARFFEGKPVVVFDARDRGSGISRIEIREGLLPWRPASSPERITTTIGLFSVRVRAIDGAGNITVADVPLPRAIRTVAIVESIGIVLVIACVCVILIRRNKSV